jgi:hypothetical protein
MRTSSPAYLSIVTAHRLLSKSLPGSRSHKARVKTASGVVALAIFDRFKIGPYRWKVTHLRWYLNDYLEDEQIGERFFKWETICALSAALGKYSHWKHYLRGPWAEGHDEPTFKLPGAAQLGLCDRSRSNSAIVSDTSHRVIEYPQSPADRPPLRHLDARRSPPS